MTEKTMDKKLTPFAERFIDISVNIFLFGALVIGFNLIGLPLDLQSGITIAMGGIRLLLLTFAISIVVHLMSGNG